MFKKSCPVCKAVGALAIVGALNWGSIGILHVNFVENIAGQGLANIAYILVGLSGLMLLAQFFMTCPKCK